MYTCLLRAIRIKVLASLAPSPDCEPQGAAAEFRRVSDKASVWSPRDKPLTNVEYMTENNKNKHMSKNRSKNHALLGRASRKDNGKDNR